MEHIRWRQQERRHRREVTSDRVLAEVYDLATVDIGEAFDRGWELLDVKDIPPHVRRAISAVEITDEVFPSEKSPGRPKTVKVKFHPKGAMLDLLMRHLGMLAASEGMANSNAWGQVAADIRLLRTELGDRGFRKLAMDAMPEHRRQELVDAMKQAEQL